MRTIRRLYFYAVAFITFEVVLWGLIRLLRSIFSPSLGSSGGDALAQALSLILVGVPIFALHWTWAQRASAADEEEQSSSLRAVFLYGALLATLIPITQNALALIDRSLISLAGMDPFRAILGGSQTWVDNLIAILMNAVVAAYFISVLRRDWSTLNDTGNFSDIRRLYRHIWLLYSLLMVIFGVQQILRFILYVPSNLLGQISRDLFINGLSLLALGVPIWFFTWKTCQEAVVQQKGESDSLLRLGVLYLLTLAGVATVLSVSGSLANLILRRVLGETMTSPEFFSRISSPISIALPLGIVWAYFGRWLRHDINAFSDEARRPGLHRLYDYILSFAGLVTVVTGMALLITFIIDRLVGHQIWGADQRLRISAALASLIIGLPLWLMTWPRVQAQARLGDATGDSARLSVIRKTYLYLALFASVIGGMVSAVTVVFRLLQAALGSQPLNLTALLTALGLLVLFIVVLVYHLRCLRTDGTEAARALVERRGKFTVLAFERTGSGFGESLRLPTQKQAQGLHLTVLAEEAEIKVDPKSVQAVILPSDLTAHRSKNLDNFLAAYEGRVIVVPVEHPRILWVGGGHKTADAAALLLRQMSEGQEIHSHASGTSAWMVLIYILAAISGLELLMILLSYGIQLIMN